MSAASTAVAPDYSAARFNMVESQVRPNKVRNTQLLDRMAVVPREWFVPPQMAGIAYIDEDLQIAQGRYLLEPMVLGRFIEEAAIRPNERVLDIGCATGYSTAILSALAREVVAVERDPNLIPLAVANLDRLGIKNASLQLGPLTDGWKPAGPYDVIILNGAADHVPDALASQLAEGGRLVAAIRTLGPANVAHTTEARLYEKVHGTLSHRGLFDANVKILPGFEAKKGFSF